MIFEDNNSTEPYFGDLTCSQKWTSRRHVTAAPLTVLNCQEVRLPLDSSIAFSALQGNRDAIGSHWVNLKMFWKVIMHPLVNRIIYQFKKWDVH